MPVGVILLDISASLGSVLHKRSLDQIVCSVFGFVSGCAAQRMIAVACIPLTNAEAENPVILLGRPSI